MSIEPPDDHLKAIWQDQPTEESAMSVQALRARADAFHRRTRLKNLAGFAVCAACAVFFAVSALQAPTAMIRAGLLIMVLGTVWMGWWIGRLWPEGLPAGDAGARQLLDAQIASLQRQLTSFRRLMLFGAPIFLGLAVEMAGLALKTHSLDRLAPVVAFLALWLAGAWWLNRRQQLALKRRIAELQALRRA